MQRFTIECVHRESGQECTLALNAATEAEATDKAVSMGFIVAVPKPGASDPTEESHNNRPGPGEPSRVPSSRDRDTPAAPTRGGAPPRTRLRLVALIAIPLIIAGIAIGIWKKNKADHAGARALFAQSVLDGQEDLLKASQIRTRLRSLGHEQEQTTVDKAMLASKIIDLEGQLREKEEQAKFEEARGVSTASTERSIARLEAEIDRKRNEMDELDRRYERIDEEMAYIRFYERLPELKVDD